MPLRFRSITRKAWKAQHDGLGFQGLSHLNLGELERDDSQEIAIPRRALPPSLMAAGAASQPMQPHEAAVSGVVCLARTMYAGANHTHLSELLNEREGIDIGRTTLRRILVNAGLSKPRRRLPPKHRVRRQRMPREGMLIQLDGSHHRWLGDERPPFALLLAVDDRTAHVAHFTAALYTGRPLALNGRRGVRWMQRSQAILTECVKVLVHRSELPGSGSLTDLPCIPICCKKGT